MSSARTGWSAYLWMEASLWRRFRLQTMSCNSSTFECIMHKSLMSLTSATSRERTDKLLLWRRAFMAAYYKPNDTPIPVHREQERAMPAQYQCPEGIGVSSQSGAPLRSSCDS